MASLIHREDIVKAKESGAKPPTPEQSAAYWEGVEAAINDWENMSYLYPLNSMWWYGMGYERGCRMMHRAGL